MDGSVDIYIYNNNNHGDPKSPKDRVVGPLPNGLFYGLYMGVTNYLLTGMILLSWTMMIVSLLSCGVRLDPFHSWPRSLMKWGLDPKYTYINWDCP